MKKFIVYAMCVLALVMSVSSCSLFSSDVSNPDVKFGWAESTGPQDINGYTCIGVMAVYVDAFQTTFGASASYKSWTTAGGECYLSAMESRDVDSYVKNLADKAISLSETNSKAKGYDLPKGETFRVVYTYGAANKQTKVLDYPVK